MASSKSGKPEKSLQEKFKQWFKGPKQPGTAGVSSTLASGPFNLSSAVLDDLGQESPVTTRIRVIKELTSSVRDRPLQDHGVELLWRKTKDLLASKDDSARQVCLYFYVSLVSGQYQKLEVMRAHFFHTIETHTNPVDLEPALLLLDAVTLQGKEILHFEERIGPYLYRTFPLLLDHEHLHDFMGILLNMIKFNPAYLDPEVVCGLIANISRVCMKVRAQENVELGLQCFYAIMGFSYIPKEALPDFIHTLCRIVNRPEHCTEAWRIMSSLMATHLGHSALYNLCQIMQLKEIQKDVALVRGAIFFVGTSLWGSKSIKSLEGYSPMTILPTFVAALDCNHHLVTYEATLQLERLVSRRGGHLRAPGCDCALDLLEALRDKVLALEDSRVQREVLNRVHNIISMLEQLSEEKLYRGSKKKLYFIIDLYAQDRPEPSVIRLLDYRAFSIYPTKPSWIKTLNDLMDKYYKTDSRDAVRTKCLAMMTEVVKSNRHMYEEELLDKTVSPFLKPLDGDPSLIVRVKGVQALTSICCECSSNQSLALLDIFERIMAKPLQRQGHSEDVEAELEDVHEAVRGLIEVFRVRLCRQPAITLVRIYNILCGFLEDSYNNPKAFASTSAGAIRKDIFSLFLAFRSNEEYHLGLSKDPEDDKADLARFSPFVVCRDFGPDKGSSSSSSSSMTYLSLTKACRLVIRTLREETDWQVLKLVLSKVPTVLQNKAIISRYGKAIHEFVTPLVELTSKTNRYPEILSNAPANLTRSEFHNHVFPVLAAMASYSEHLESSAQKNLINSLHVGLLSRDCSKICIIALTACALEMKRSMYHLIPQVILNFSKISPTKVIAMPMLDFLSTLIRLPDIFSSFTDTDYMSVFAIALPCTNPFKYDAYTVSLAHHVIIMWFLKCRLAYRQNFVQFIISALNNNIQQSYDEGALSRKSLQATPSTATETKPTAMAKPLANMDSSARRRSSSLSDHAARMRQGLSLAARSTITKAKGVSGTGSGEDPDAQLQEKAKLAEFHQELTETCQDILARYMFANTSLHPKRMPTTQFLLKGGSSATWLLNAMIITVTTSHCDQNANRGGLCDRCYLICSKTPQVSSPPPPVGEPVGAAVEVGSDARKRHQSEFQVQRPSPSRYLPGNSAKDDYIMRRQMSVETLQGGGSDTGLGKPDSTVATEEMGKLEKVLAQQKEEAQKKPEMCSCWCSGWAEVHVRRPSGDVSWMCRIQNSSLVSESFGEFPLTDLTNLFHSSLDDSRAEGSLQGAADGQETFSIFHKIATDEVEDEMLITTTTSESTPRSPIKRSASIAGQVVSDPKEHESPAAPSPDPRDESGSGKSSRQSCDPIPEHSDHDPDPKLEKQSILKRRTSLQFGGGELAARPVASSRSSSPKKAHTPPTSGLGSVPLRARQSDLGHPHAGLRDRAQTVSGPSPRKTSTGSMGRRPFLQTMSVTGSSSSSASASAAGSSGERVTGISPQFVFLQLYHGSGLSTTNEASEKPILLPATKSMEASIRNLDRIYAQETHKIGVVYVGPGQQDDETAILCNEFGSLRYAQFLNGLGSLISLKDIDKATTYLGGLDHSDGDGDFAYMWEDDVMQLIFHTATLMPNHENDPKANKKKRHIGNDYVAIVYNNSGGRYKLGTVKGQFIYASVVVVPLDQGSNRVFIECLPELSEPLGHLKHPKVVSDRNLSVLVRQLALHCNLAAQISRSLKTGKDPYSSNCLERLRAIKRIREKALKEEKTASTTTTTTASTTTTSGATALTDFTGVVLRRVVGKDPE